MSGVPVRAEDPVYELAEGGSTLRVYPHDGAELDDFLTVEINGPADSVRLSWGDAVELSDVLRDAIGMGTFKQDALCAAEKRGAVKALRWLADDLKRSGPDATTRDLANAIHADARRIESGEVTLP